MDIINKELKQYVLRDEQIYTCEYMSINTLHVYAFHTNESRVLKLEELNLNDNYISKLHNEQFSMLLLLKTIRLRNNSITVISSSVFSKNINIVNIVLYNNKIVRFNFNVGELKSLWRLDLGYNKLSTLRETSFKDYLVKNNTILGISDNTLICDCSMLWVRKLDTINTQIHTRTIDICSAVMSINISVSCFMMLQPSDRCIGVIHEDQCEKGNIFHYMYIIYNFIYI